MAEDIGMAREEILGKTSREIFGQEAGAKAQQIDMRVLNGETIEQQRQLMCKGLPMVVLTKKIPLEEKGSVVGILGISRNITDRVIPRPVCHGWNASVFKCHAEDDRRCGPRFQERHIGPPHRRERGRKRPPCPGPCTKTRQGREQPSTRSTVQRLRRGWPNPSYLGTKPEPSLERAEGKGEFWNSEKEAHLFSMKLGNFLWLFRQSSYHSWTPRLSPESAVGRPLWSMLG